MVEKFAKVMSTTCKTNRKLRLPSLSEKHLRQQAESRAAQEQDLRKEVERRAAEETCLRQEAESRAAEEKCLRQEAESRAAQEQDLRKEAESRAAEENCLRQEAESRAAEEKCLRQEAESRAAQEQDLRKEAESRAAEENCLRQEAESRAAQEQDLRKETESRAAQEQDLRKEAESRAAEEKCLRQEAESRAAQEKCLRQAALQGRGSILQKLKLKSLLDRLRCKKRAKRDEWLFDPCGAQGSACSADGGKIQEKSRRVFSIVMSEYQEPKKLPNALNDAEEVGKTFGKLDYTVESPEKNVPRDTLLAMFSKFLKTLNTETYTVILHIAGHGFQQDGHLVLDLIDGSEVYLDELLFDLNDRLDEIVKQSKSQDDPVHSAGVLVIWDACREALSIPGLFPLRKSLRGRQQAIIHSCMSGGRSEEAVADSKNSPLILALSNLLGTKSPFTVFELAEHLNARVKAATKGRQSVELRSEATKLNTCYDWFVDLEKCNQLRAYDVTLKRLQAENHDLKACARLISLWKVPCKSIESVEDVEDCLQSLQDSQQRLLSDWRAPWLDATVQAERRADEEKRFRQDAERRADDAERSREEAEGRAAEEKRLREKDIEKVQQEKDHFRKTLEAARGYRRQTCSLLFIFNFLLILPFSCCHSRCQCWKWICTVFDILCFFGAMMDPLLGLDG